MDATLPRFPAAGRGATQGRASSPEWAREPRHSAGVDAGDPARLVLDATGRIHGCNASAEGLLALRPDEVAGLVPLLPDGDLYDAAGAPLSAGRHPALWTLRTGVPLAGRVFGLRREGRTRWLLAATRPVRLEGDRPGVAACFTDVTPQHAAARAAAAAGAADTLAAAFEAFAAVVREVVDHDVARFLVRDGGELVVAAVAGAVAPTDAVGTRRPGEVPSAAGTPDGLTVPVVVAGERRGWVCLGVEPGRLRPGDPALVAGMTRAVAGTFEALRALAREQEAADRLRELDRRRTDLLGLVAHDLRSPLSIVVGSARTLAIAGARLSPTEQRDLLDTIARRGRTMAQLVSRVLDVTELESDAAWLEPVATDLADAIRDTLADLTRAHPERVFRLLVEADLPDVLVDPHHHERILLNLLANALTFAPPAEPVTIEVRRAGDCVAVAVTDRGPGVAEADRPLLFDRFRRLARGRRPESGLGLGLYVCRLLVEAHGGSIELADPVDGGSTFRYTLPVAPAA